MSATPAHPRGASARSDSAPAWHTTRLQMVVGLLVVGIIAKVVLGAVRVAESRRSREPGRTEAPTDVVL